ncbi:MAG TPA: tetratricopeptide repeat protein [Aggregatilineales bacterium]|nr:tetratricopeptide repeat protein [Chloroflexota bacterium]HOA24978.1 tetratricopeptide repeat protein [Aggregatilineales bacterium]HPV07093.1 tetratricopeptide repeat protein [Aggregatilineales bacterium]HQA68961.1 tetratricopeptide repeat protein [Aggregatilineales bacterium]
MSISLKERRRRSRRRSYADWKPPGRNNGPRNDPFRIVFYLVLIAAGIWVYFNQDMVRAELFGGTVEGQPRQGLVATRAEPSGDEVLSAEELEAQAEQAYMQGQLLDAVELYRSASEVAPDHTNNYVQIARLLIYESATAVGEQRDALLEQAMEAAETAILVDPYDPAGYAIKGKVFDWQGRPDQAASTILRALDIDKNYGLAHGYLAETYVDLSRWDQAQTSIEQALALNGDHVDVRRDYGYMHEMFGDYASAATQYEAALNLHPRLMALRVSLARVYRELGRYDEALDQLFEAQTINPTNALVAYELGRTYESYIGDTEAAMEYYGRAAELAENFGSPWVRLGSLRYFNGRYADAIVAFERAIALDSLPDTLKYQVGLAYANEGRCEIAIQYLDEAMAIAQDEMLIDAITSGYEMCSAPTPEPGELESEETPSAEDGSGEEPPSDASGEGG